MTPDEVNQTAEVLAAALITMSAPGRREALQMIKESNDTLWSLTKLKMMQYASGT